MNKFLKVAGIIVVIALILGYVLRVSQAHERKKVKAVSVRPISVRTVPVKEGMIEDFVYATGTIRAVKREYCYFESSGKVVFVRQVAVDKESGKERDIREGDKVKKGELLAQVDPRNLQQDVLVEKATLREAEASFEKAEIDYKRQKSLFDKNIGSKADFESYDLALKKAIETVNTRKAKLKQAEVNLEHSKIFAPCDGIIAYMNVKMGAYFSGESNARTESEVLNWIPFVILHDNEMELTADVPAAYADLVKVGQEVYIFRKTLNIDSADGFNVKPEKVLATVYSVNPAIDPGGRSVQVKIRTRIKNYLFRDGQYVSCWIIVRKADSALIIPFNTLMFEDGKPYCFVEENGVAKRRDVKIGIQSINDVQIRKGLNAGDKVISEGNYRLVNNTKVVDTERE